MLMWLGVVVVVGDGGGGFCAGEGLVLGLSGLMGRRWCLLVDVDSTCCLYWGRRWASRKRRLMLGKRRVRWW